MKRSDPHTLLGRELSAAALDCVLLPGGRERPRVRPAGIEELRTVLRLAASERWSCLVLGKGSRLGWGPPLTRVDLAISTEAHEGIVSFEPGDGTLTARAGTGMDELRESMGRAGYHLTPDVARPAGSTLGGVLGAGSSGFDRLRYGPVRHHVLGMQVMLADGSLAKTGGRLVKNVTGYDLHRLYCGSRGSLCVILEATLRLFPAPDVHTAIAVHCETRSAALRMGAVVGEARVRPIAVVARPRTVGTAESPAATRWELFVFLAGRERTLEGERARLATALGETRHLSTAEEEEMRFVFRDFGSPRTDAIVLEISTLPSRLDAALSVAQETTSEFGLAPRIVAAPRLGCATLLLPAATAHDDLEALENSLAETGSTRRWRNVPNSLATKSEIPEPADRLMQALRRSLDPEGLFATQFA